MPISAYADETSIVLIPDKLGLSAEPNRNTEKIFEIYGLVDNTRVQVFSSDLVDSKQGLVITSDKVLFNGQKNLDFIINGDESKQIKISTSIPKTGSFSGKLFVIANETTIIPIKVSSGILFWEPLVLILGGFFISIGLWTVKSMRSVKREFSGLLSRTRQINKRIYEYRVFIKNFTMHVNLMVGQLLSLEELMVKSNVNGSKKILNVGEKMLAEMTAISNLDPTEIDKLRKKGMTHAEIIIFLANLESKEELSEDGIAGPIGSVINKIKNLKFSYWKYIGTSSFLNKLVLNVTALSVLVFFSFGGFVQKELFTELYTIDGFDIVILLSTGIGIYHIKEIISLKIN